MTDKISLSQGGGGLDSKQLVDSIVKILENPVLNAQDDAGIVSVGSGKIAFTTDGFVVKPIFFPGGDIGKLAICGTINDLAVMAAKPVAISLSLIIEEGFSKDNLNKIINSIKKTAGEIPIVAGDTKVVEHGAVDGIFITTSGIGFQNDSCQPSGSNVMPGDVVIVTGSIGRHGACVMAAREELGFFSQIQSDVAPLWELLSPVFKAGGNEIHACRDITRGGLATILSEFASSSHIGFEISSTTIPIDPDVKGLCDALGLDPYNLACEGRALMSVSKKVSDEVLALLKSNELGKNATIIGLATDSHPGMSYIKTSIGGRTILEPPAGELLPRIC